MVRSDERIVVAAMYPARGWKKKVDKMSDAQVHAIYIKEQQRQESEPQEPEDKPDIPF